MAGVYFFRYYYHLDRGELAEALESIEKVARAPNEPEFRNTMLLELAYARARIGRDVDGARQAFGEFRAVRDAELVAHRAQAAIARLGGDDAAAETHLEAARSLLAKEADLDSTQAEREFLEAILEIEPL